MLMKKSGLLAAAAPEQFGGLGVESAHDITVAISRLARGCGSTAIAANMHIGAVWVVTRNWRQGIATGDTAASEGLGQFLPVLGQSQVIVSGAGTESGSSFVFPQTTATPVDGGYVINGHKIFATNSDIADSVTVFLKIPDGDGWWRSGMAIVLRGAKGMDVRGNWDAMGMRGSGSHDIVFTDCFVPTAMVFPGAPVGEFGTDGWLGLAVTNYALVGAFLGIAEAARQHIVDHVKTRRKPPFDHVLAERPATQFQIAEIDVALTAARAALARTGEMIDEHIERPDSELTQDDVRGLMHQWQCTKLIVNRAAADVVDRALALTGGAGYLSEQCALAVVPRRARRAVHATLLAQRSVRVHRTGHARPRTRHRDALATRTNEARGLERRQVAALAGRGGRDELVELLQDRLPYLFGWDGRSVVEVLLERLIAERLAGVRRWPARGT